MNTFDSPKNRSEVVLLALGFRPPNENENNPWLWFNKYFDGIEVELVDNSWTVTSISSTFMLSGCTTDKLMDAINQQLQVILNTLADEECGIV